MKVADILLQVLSRHQLKYIFGIPGDAINHIIDAIRRQDDISLISVRHEEAGALAASAQAKLTGRLSVCMGTAGPGAIHLLNGLYDAKMDHAPVLAITGQVETQYIGTDYHQEVNLERLFEDVAVYSQTITSDQQLPGVVQEACRAAVSSRGVAHICLPADMASRNVSTNASDYSVPIECGTMCPEDSAIRAALELIGVAERITILAGVGCRNAREELLTFAERLGAPIVRTLKAKDVIDDSESLCVGGLGLLGGVPAIRAMEQCDLLVMLGSDFPYTQFYPEQAKVIQIDNVATQIGKRHPVDIGLPGDVGATLSELLLHISKREQTSFLRSIQGEMDNWLEKQGVDELSSQEPIKPQRIMYDIGAIAPEDTIFVCDTGTVTAWAARHLHLGKDHRFILSSALGSMAFALPASIGAQLSYPDKQVIALCGDGAFTMLMPEFLTAVREGLPIIVIVFNNNELGFIGLEQRAEGLPTHGIDIPNPDFAGFAENCGGKGYRVEKAEQIEPTLQEALLSTTAVVIDVKVDSSELVMPAKLEFKSAINFGIAKAREIIST